MSKFMNLSVKFITITFGGILITTALFYTMQEMINIEFEKPVPGIIVDEILSMYDFPELVVHETQPLPPQPPEISEQPNTSKTTFGDGNFEILYNEKTTPEKFTIPEPDTNNSDRSALPLVKIQPSYPAFALSRGLEGYVVVEFEINESGMVTNPRVLYAEPANVFENSAIKALQRWRYQPKIKNGNAVKVYGVQTKLSFNLQD